MPMSNVVSSPLLLLVPMAAGCAGPQLAEKSAPVAEDAGAVIEATLEPDGSMTLRLPPRSALAAHGRPGVEPIAADEGLLGLLTLDVRNHDAAEANGPSDRPLELAMGGDTTLAEVHRLLRAVGAERFPLSLTIP